MVVFSRPSLQKNGLNEVFFQHIISGYKEVSVSESAKDRMRSKHFI